MSRFLDTIIKNKNTYLILYCFPKNRSNDLPKSKKKNFFRFSEICNFREEKLVSEFLLTGFGILVRRNPFPSFSSRVLEFS